MGCVWWALGAAIVGLFLVGAWSGAPWVGALLTALVLLGAGAMAYRRAARRRA